MTPLEALQATLAGEHAAVYVYGVAGGRVSSSAVPALAEQVAEGYRTHRDRRDQLDAMVRAAGAEPVPAEVAYEVPEPARTSSQLEALVREVETRCSALYADMVGSTSGEDRRWALDALEDAAVRALGLGAEPEPFPGVGEL